MTAASLFRGRSCYDKMTLSIIKTSNRCTNSILYTRVLRIALCRGRHILPHIFLPKIGELVGCLGIGEVPDLGRKMPGRRISAARKGPFRVFGVFCGGTSLSTPKETANNGKYAERRKPEIQVACLHPRHPRNLRFIPSRLRLRPSGSLQCFFRVFNVFRGSTSELPRP